MPDLVVEYRATGFIDKWMKGEHKGSEGRWEYNDEKSIRTTTKTYKGLAHYTFEDEGKTLNLKTEGEDSATYTFKRLK